MNNNLAPERPSKSCTQSQLLEFKLEQFFCDLKEVLPQVANEPKMAKAELGAGLDLEKLQELFKNFPNAVLAARSAGFLCDPWMVASLKRNEVRNSAVLAWWLDPKGSHGFGDALLRNILHELPAGLPACVSNHCSVRVESCPDGDRSNRVDIEIDDLKFFLIIEVKIDAPEGKDQLGRYCQIAQARAGKRPWAVIFLTPNGRSPAVMHDSAIPMSWKTVATFLDSTARQRSRDRQNFNAPEHCLTALLARQFSKQIRNF